MTQYGEFPILAPHYKRNFAVIADAYIKSFLKEVNGFQFIKPTGVDVPYIKLFFRLEDSRVQFPHAFGLVVESVLDYHANMIISYIPTGIWGDRFLTDLGDFLVRYNY